MGQASSTSLVYGSTIVMGGDISRGVLEGSNVTAAMLKEIPVSPGTAGIAILAIAIPLPDNTPMFPVKMD